MLPQLWAQVPDTPWGVAELQGYAGLTHRLTGRGMMLKEHLAVLYLGVGKDLGRGVYWANTDVLVSKICQPVVTRALQENRLQLCAHTGFLGTGSAGEVLEAAVVARQLWATESCTEIFPKPGLAAAYREASIVLGLVGGVEGVQACVGAITPLWQDAIGKSIGHQRGSGQ